MKKSLLASAVAVLLAGCATIISGTSDTVTVKSAPEGAQISITNRAGEKIHTGTTPATVTLKRGAGYFKSEAYQIVIEKDGFKPYQFVLAGQVSGWYVANILFGGLIGLLVVDPITGAMYRLTPESTDVVLESLDQKTSQAAGALTIVLRENVSEELMQNARQVN